MSAIREDDALVYGYAHPYPTDRAMRRLGVLFSLCCIGAVVATWAAGFLRLSDAAWVGGGALFIILPLLLAERLWSSRGGITLTPSALLIRETRLLGRQHEYPWEDVASISQDTWREFGRFNWIFAIIMYGPESSRPYVKIRVSRSVRYSLGGGRMGTRIFGMPMPGVKTLRIFLEEPDRFIEDVQPYLQGRDVGTVRPPASASG